MAPSLSNGSSHNGNRVAHNGVSHIEVSPKPDLDTVLSLANKVSELAAPQKHQVPVPQKDFLQAIQRLQIAVEGPPHYVARKRYEVQHNTMHCLAS